MDHVSDQEQVEALKKWWKENGMAIVGGLVIGLAGVLGWQYWQSRSQDLAAQASDLYQQVVAATRADQTEEAVRLVDALRESHAESPYAALAAFVLAAGQVDSDRLSEAEPLLRWVMDHGSQGELGEVARLRLARVLLAQDKADEAVAIADGASQPFRAEADEIRGDAFLSKGDRARAREAYQSARAAAALEGRNRPLLEMKLNDLTEVSEASESGTAQ